MVTLPFAVLAAVLAAGSALAQDPGDWAHQQLVSVFNPGSTLTDYQVKVVLDPGNFDFARAESDGADLLFANRGADEFYPYWIETWDPLGKQAAIWVRVPTLPGGETTVFALLTGNPSAPPRSDGEATFLFYSGFEGLPGSSRMNAPAPLVTPTYDGSGQAVHPDVVYVPGGWNGYEYWMGMTPYPNSNDDYENPSVLASNDNVTWVVPPGVANPLAPEPPGHNDDVDMLLVGGEMIIYYNETNSDGNTYMKRLASTDGVDWGAAQTVFTVPNYVMSPTVIHDGGVFTMWYTWSAAGCTGPGQDFYFRTSTDGIAWGPEQPATIDHPGRVLWHQDVQLKAGLYTMLFNSYPDGSHCGNTQLYYAESLDGVNWVADPSPVLVPSVSRWDSSNIYRASHILDGTWLRLWYSALSTTGQWRVGYTEGDLDDFLTEPMASWTELNGNVAATTDYPRTGEYGLREIGGSTYPQAFGPLYGGNVCINVWYWEEMSTAVDFMALLRMWDTASSYHCIGTGIWTGTSTSSYSWHNEDFSYAAAAVPRAAGWRHVSIAIGASTAVLSIDGSPVASTMVLDPALIDRFSVEGYQGGTGYFDDAYVRRYVENEPEVSVGDLEVAGTEDGPGDEPNGGGSQLPSASVVLEQNVPNPLNPATHIAFRLPQEAFVKLEIVDLRGRLVRTLLAETRAQGRHEVDWDGRDGQGTLAASGVYFYRLTTAEGTVSRKLMLVK